MFLYENNQETLGFEDIDADYNMLKLEKIDVSEPKMKLFFNKDRKLVDIEDMQLSVRLNLPEAKDKYVMLTYSPIEYDDKFDIADLSDDIYEVDETGNDEASYMLTVSDLFELQGVLDAKFTRTIEYPFSNSSKGDTVNRYLNRTDVDDITKLIKYVKELVYKVDEYKPIHQSWSNQNTRTQKKKAAEDAWRAGRTDIEILRDNVKKYPGVVNVQLSPMNATSKYTDRLRIFTDKREVFEVLCAQNKYTKMYKYLIRRMGNVFNAYEAGSIQQAEARLKALMKIERVKETEVEDDDIDMSSVSDLEYTEKDHLY